MRNLNHPTGLLLVLSGALLGAIGTTLVLSRARSVPPVAAQHSALNAHGKAGHSEEGQAEEGHGEAHSPIRLTDEARKTAGIRVEPARTDLLGESLTVPGTVEVSPNHGARVTPPAPGKIVRILANLGDRVRAGQPLAVLDSYEVAQAHAALQDAGSSVRQAQAGLQTARAEVAQAQAGIRIAEAEVDQARTRQRSAETALARQKELAAAGAFSQAPLQAAQSELNEAQSELLKAQTELQTHLTAMQRAERLFREELISRQELEQAQLEHRQDQTQVEQAQAHAAIAKQALERERRVASGDLLNRQAIQSAEGEVRAAQGEVQKALQGVARARQDVRRAQKGEQAARTALQGAEAALTAARSNLYALEGGGHLEGSGGLLTMRAPIAGTVTEKQATLGEAVERTTALYVIENLHTVMVQAQVPEKDVGRVRAGQPVEVTVAAYPGRRFFGVVQSLAGRLDEKTRALPVRALVENRGGLLRPEMFARVHLAVGPRTATLRVPTSALDQDGEDRYVFVEEGDGFERRLVQTGRAFGEQIEIVSGLRPGEQVVVEGVFVLKSESRKDELKGHED